MSIKKFGHSEDPVHWSRKMNEMMDEMLKRTFVHFRDSAAWQPAVNVYETRSDFLIVVELPGVQAGAVEVTCADQCRITISGTRAQPRPDGAPNPLSLHVLEIEDGPFRREVTVPEPLLVDDIQVTYESGFLWITAPRARKR